MIFLYERLPIRRPSVVIRLDNATAELYKQVRDANIPLYVCKDAVDAHKNHRLRREYVRAWWIAQQAQGSSYKVPKCLERSYYKR